MGLRYPPNTLVMLYAGRLDSPLDGKLACVEVGNPHSPIVMQTKKAYEPRAGLPCKYSAFLGQCQMKQTYLNKYDSYDIAIKMAHRDSPHVKVRNLISHIRNCKMAWVLLQLPVTVPYRKKGVSVGVCLAPMFYYEEWELLITLMEIYSYFGVELSVFYVMSILDEAGRILDVMLLRYRSDSKNERSAFRYIRTAD